MLKRGVKPKGLVKIKWSPEFAYAIGLIVTDGSLSKDGRHIVFVSGEIELIDNFQKSLGLKLRVGKKKGGYSPNKNYHYVQFGDVLFFKFLESIGIMPNKTKIMGPLKIPSKYFVDFLRGHLDGDGCTYSYYDIRWKNSYMFYTTFVSASKNHINWLRSEIKNLFAIKGHITKSNNSSIFQLKYAKKESLIILKKLYYSRENICLSRKRLKVNKMLAIIGEKL